MTQENLLQAANAYYREGHDALVKGDCAKAEVIFNDLLNGDKDSELILFNLAGVYWKKKDYALARILYKVILDRQPEFLEAMNNLGIVCKELNLVDEYKEAFRKTFELAEKIMKVKKIENPEDYYVNIGSTYVANGTPEKALEYLNKAIEINPNEPKGHWNRALALLELGRYEEGFRDYEFSERVETCKNRYHAEIPYWDGTPGKTIAIFGEQGIGDELMFASVLPDVIKDCKVILDMHPRLQRMFQLNYPHIPVYGTRKAGDGQYPWIRSYKIDAKASIASLCKFYRKKKEDFPGTPYLKAEPELVAKYKEKLAAMGPKKKIGISWKGGTGSTNKHTRKIQMELLLPLLKCEQYDFISLQYDKGVEVKVKEFEEQYGVKLNHWQDVLDDYDETAGLVSNLDLIISVPQSVVHLAGALGTPTLQLCPMKGLWQMGVYGEDMPWYSCVRNIWQVKDGEWETVIDIAKGELCSL